MMVEPKKVLSIRGMTGRRGLYLFYGFLLVCKLKPLMINVSWLYFFKNSFLAFKKRFRNIGKIIYELGSKEAFLAIVIQIILCLTHFTQIVTIDFQIVLDSDTFYDLTSRIYAPLDIVLTLQPADF